MGKRQSDRYTMQRELVNSLFNGTGERAERRGGEGGRRKLSLQKKDEHTHTREGSGGRRSACLAGKGEIGSGWGLSLKGTDTQVTR